jgi:predicted nucleotidyltransferase
VPGDQPPNGDSVTFEDLEQSLKRAAASLRDADVPFVLGGSLAAWARGGPRLSRDLDLFVKRDDAERALDALVKAGMRPERPPEDWLLKVWDGSVMIDLIFEARGLSVTDEVLARADELNVLSMPMRVLALEDVMTTKLLALTEQTLDYGRPVQIARALREQIDWGHVRARTEESAYARAFLFLLEELGVIESPSASAAVKVSPEGNPRDAGPGLTR